jgi:hypothetical protein
MVWNVGCGVQAVECGVIGDGCAVCNVGAECWVQGGMRRAWRA